MDKNKFSFKVKLNDNLLSIGSVFDKGSIGDIDGRSYFINALWFDRNLYIKYIEVAVDGIEKVFITPAAAFIFNGIMTLPRSGNFVKNNASNLLDSLSFVSRDNLDDAARAVVGQEDFIIRDFLIDPREWKIAALARGNWSSPEIVRISRLDGFDGNNSYNFGS